MWDSNESSFHFDEDSFEQHMQSDQEMQNVSVPSAIPANYERHWIGKERDGEGAGRYDLTFKKQRQSDVVSSVNTRQRLFDGTNGIKRQQLFPQSRNPREEEHPAIQILSKAKSISEAYQKLLQQYHNSSILLTELLNISQESDEWTEIKLKTMINMLTIKNLRKKKNSAKINMEAIKAAMEEKDLTEVQKRRLELLGMLVVQIEKKLLIEQLKYNLVRKKWKLIKVNEAEEREEDIQEPDDVWNEYFPGETEREEKQKDKGSPLRTSHTPSQSPYLQQTRLAVFIQIISAFTNKSVYPALKCICGYQPQLIVREEHQEEVSEQQQGEDHEMERQQENPVDAIYGYIQSLKKQYVRQPTQKLQILKNSFLKWKIFFLHNIIQKIENEPEPEPEPEPIRQYASMKSIDGDLKQEKYLLKQYLRAKRIKEGLKCLSENRHEKKIEEIMREQYRKNLKQKAFKALFENKKEVQAGKYADYVAENQNYQHERTASIFYKTNGLAKAYFGLKNMTKYSKFIRRVEKFIKSFGFYRLKFQTDKDAQNQIKLSKFLERKKRQFIFKYFCLLKNQTSFRSDLSFKVDQFRNKRDHELVEVCFSALSLEWKKKLAKQKKVQNMRSYFAAKEFFRQLFLTADRRSEEQDLEVKAGYVVEIQKKQSLIQNLQANYLRSLISRKLEVKAAKFQIQRVNKMAREGLTQWRKFVICKNNYKVIQKKLRKVKQVEQKQKLFKIWQERLQQKLRDKRKDKLTTSHNIWLNKYYRKLCEIEQQEIS